MLRRMETAAANRPNALLVEEPLSADADPSAVALSPAKMDQLGLFNGDAVLLRGKKRKDTVCIAQADEVRCCYCCCCCCCALCVQRV
jgi:Cell division protein 48 (CDC48), N-terminal domain